MSCQGIVIVVVGQYGLLGQVVALSQWLPSQVLLYLAGHWTGAVPVVVQGCRMLADVTKVPGFHCRPQQYEFLDAATPIAILWSVLSIMTPRTKEGVELEGAGQGPRVQLLPSATVLHRWQLKSDHLSGACT